MLGLRHVPVVKVLIPFMVGSFVGYQYDLKAEPLSLFFLTLLLWVLAMLIYGLSERGSLFAHPVFSLFVPALFGVTGLGIGILDKAQDPGIPEASQLFIQGKIREEPEFRKESLVFGLDLQMAGSENIFYCSQSLVKVYMPLNQGGLVPEEGEEWFFFGSLSHIKNPGNPGEVDYAAILKRKDCWYSFYVDTLFGLNHPVTTFSYGLPDPGKLRRALTTHWEGSRETQALLKAVCLGDRAGLSEEILHSYSMAGGMHVLAVSGLHVGLIWWMLNKLFYFIILMGKPEIYRALFITIVLWVYAYMTGFSSSVSRAVTMFTIYSFSRILNHRGASMNAVLISMFILVLIKPGRLLDIGFQLSYAAVFSIVLLTPVFRSLWKPRMKLMSWCWDVSALSFAAQLGTLPLVIYYFHQLPVYALLTNIFALPLLSMIIVLFMVSAPFFAFGCGSAFFNTLLNLTASALNHVMEIIASIPGAVVGELYTAWTGAVMMLILLLLLYLFLNSRRRFPLYIAVFLLCFTLLWHGGSLAADSQKTEVRISHFWRGSLLSIRDGLQVDHYLLTENTSALIRMDSYLSQAWGKSRFELSVIHLDKEQGSKTIPGGISCAIQVAKDIWLLGNEEIRGLVLGGNPGEMELDLLSELEADFVLLSGEPALSFEELGDPTPYMVVDGSCRSWYLNSLKNSGLRFYNTSKLGAFELAY